MPKGSPRLKSLETKLKGGKRNHKLLQFPLDVTTSATQNIMLININAISGSKFANGNQYTVEEGTEAVNEQKGSTSLARHFKGNTVRIDTSIALYMPPSLQTTYQSNWATTDLGLSGAVVDGWKGMGDLTSMADWKNNWNTAKENLPSILAMTGIKMADTILGNGIKPAYLWANQTLENPYTEVLFNGVTNRTFSFTFKFIPKSRNEQLMIKQIIDTLKFHRAPEKKSNDINLYWSYPSTFDISFLKKDGTVNDWVFKISTCALTDLSIQQGSDSHFASYDDGSPFSTSITLSFTELEVLDKSRILEGF